MNRANGGRETMAQGIVLCGGGAHSLALTRFLVSEGHEVRMLTFEGNTEPERLAEARACAQAFSLRQEVITEAVEPGDPETGVYRLKWLGRRLRSAARLGDEIGAQFIAIGLTEDDAAQLPSQIAPGELPRLQVGSVLSERQHRVTALLAHLHGRLITATPAPLALAAPFINLTEGGLAAVVASLPPLANLADGDLAGESAAPSDDGASDADEHTLPASTQHSRRRAKADA